MYILTQDKKTLMEFGRIEVSTNITFKKDDKYVLIAFSRASANSTTNSTVIGTYPSEEVALNELRNIYMALNANQPVYEVR